MRDQRFVAGSNVTLKSCPVKWAHLTSPDTKYEHKWCVDAYLNDVDAKEMKALGFNIKDGEDGPFIKLSRKCVTRAGKKLSPPKVVGRDPKVLFTEDIGNGSICNINIYAVYRTVKGTEILCAYLEAVQVLDHVEYKGNGGFSDESDAGSI